MSGLVQILYNHQDAFSPQPTPLVGLDEQSIFVGELWARKETLTMNGQLTGCSFSGIVDAQNTLLSRFNKSFQSLEIWQTENGVSGKVFEKDFVEIQSINFPEDRMFGVLPYTITLSCYPSGLFSGAFGILNPEDNWSFQEQENATMTVTHTIACQPFNTSSGPSNALDNARNWAFGRTGINSTVYPIMISGVSPANFCLLTQQESINRFNGTYSLVENYTNDLARTGYGTIRYSATVDSGNNLITVNLQGTAQGGGQNITGLRYAFSQLDKTAIAVTQYQDAFNRTDLNPIPLVQSFIEDPFNTRIDFNYAFDNSNLPPVVFDYTVDLSVGTNGAITATIGGVIHARGGTILDRLATCKAYAATVNLYNLTLPFYNPFDTSSSVPLNTVPVNQGQTNNQTDGTVSLNAVFNNKLLVSPVFDRFDYTVNITPSLAQVDMQPVLEGLGTYSVVNLNFGSRAIFVLDGTAVVNRDASADVGVALARQKAFQLFAQYGNFANPTLDKNIVTMSRTDNRLLSFSFQWSYGPNYVIGPSFVNALPT